MSCILWIRNDLMVGKESCLSNIFVYDKVSPVYKTSDETVSARDVIIQSLCARSSRASAQCIQSSRSEQKKLSHLTGKAREKPTRLTSKRLNYSDASSWTRRNRMWVSGSVWKHLQDQVPFLVSGSPWEVSFHVKTLWHIWSAPYALILDHRGHLHIHRLCNNHEKTRPDRAFVYELWDLVSKTQLFFCIPRQTRDIWPNSSLAYKLWICIAH